MRKYLVYLLCEMEKTGRITYNKQILTKDSIFSKQEKHIFNCLGLSGPLFFEDKSPMIPIKGTVLSFDLNPYKSVKDFILFMKT